MRIVSPRLSVLAAALVVVVGLVPGAADARRKPVPTHRAFKQHGLAFYDVREAGGRARRPRAVKASAREADARRSYGRRLGPQGVLDIDPATGTPRQVMRLDGALTGPAEDGPAAVALRYLHDHATALGLTAGDLDTLRLQDRQTTQDGITILRWRQVANGIPAFDNGVSVVLDRANRVISVNGSPVSGLGEGVADPTLSASEALAAARRDVAGGAVPAVTDGPSGARETTTFADGSTAALAIFAVAGQDQMAWDITTPGDGANVYHVAVDATSGRMLFRANLTRYIDAQIFDYYPGANAQTSPRTVTLPSGWNTSSSSLTGEYSHTYSDLNDDNSPTGEETATSGGNYSFGFTSSFAGATGCSSSFLCSWSHTNLSTSWTTNQKQNATQVYWFVSTFHDHLANANINFTASNGDHAFEGSAQRVNAEADDGASLLVNGGSDLANHVDNANMSTPSASAVDPHPRMQMYLFYGDGFFRDVNGGDDAAIVYHEYTHGLSSRLVVNPSDGTEALDNQQPGAMGEAWSDWYAMDFLVDQGYQADNPGTAGEIDMGAYTDATPNQIRSQPLDCPVGDNSSGKCPGAGTAGAGGYTYGDFGKICTCGAEVHADGEIWGETLWDLRAALGSNTTERLLTDAMRLSPPQPSFLDERNAILAADTADFGGANRDAIWNVFKARGMGFYASTFDSSDTAPVEDFSSPPASGTPTGTISGRVIDATTGLPLTGVPVSIGGHATKSATNFDYFATTSGSGGAFSLGGIPAGTYPQLTGAANNGYDRYAAAVTVPAGGSTTATLAERRDWAASSGGATMASFTGPDNTVYGCGPDGAIDQSQGTGWGANNPARGGATPSITVQLPRAITVSSFEIDPSAICGDGASATLKNYKIETSPDGTTWSTAVDASSTGGFSPSDAGHLTSVNPTGGTTNVRYVRVTLYHPQDESSSSLSGYNFIDLAEFELRGGPPNVLPSGSLAVSPASATTGQTLTFDATGITDPDSAISAYHWDFNGDGTVDSTTSSATTTTTAPAAGSYTGKVTVDDFAGGSYTASAPYGVSSSSTTTTPTTTTPNPPPPAAKAPTFGFTGTQPAAGRTFRVACDSRCFGSAQLLAPRSLARKLGLKSKRFGVKAFTKAGKVTVMLTTAVRRAARRHHVRRLRLTLKVTVTTARGVKKTFSRTVTLRL